MLHAERETFGRKGGLGGGDVKDSPVAVELVIDITTNVDYSSGHNGQKQKVLRLIGKMMSGSSSASSNFS